MLETGVIENILDVLSLCARDDNVDDAEGRVDADAEADIDRNTVSKPGPDADKTSDATAVENSNKLVEQAIVLLVSRLSMSILHSDGIKLSLFQMAIGPLFLDQAKLLM